MISIRVKGDSQKLFERLDKLTRVDKTELNKALAETLRTSTMKRFTAQEGPEGEKWRTSIRASSENGKTLSKTARLRNSIRARGRGDGFAVGTNTIYAATHQFGDSRTIKAKTSKGLRFQINGRWIRKQSVKINIPARPFLGISKKDYREIEGVLDDYFGGN